MSIAIIFILYFGIKKTHFLRDTGDWRGQYTGYHSESLVLSLLTLKVLNFWKIHLEMEWVDLLTVSVA